VVSEHVQALQQREQALVQGQTQEQEQEEEREPQQEHEPLQEQEHELQLETVQEEEQDAEQEPEQGEPGGTSSRGDTGALTGRRKPCVPLLSPKTSKRGHRPQAAEPTQEPLRALRSFEVCPPRPRPLRLPGLLPATSLPGLRHSKKSPKGRGRGRGAGVRSSGGPEREGAGPVRALDWGSGLLSRGGAAGGAGPAPCCSWRRGGVLLEMERGPIRKARDLSRAHHWLCRRPGRAGQGAGRGQGGRAGTEWGGGGAQGWRRRRRRRMRRRRLSRMRQHGRPCFLCT